MYNILKKILINKMSRSKIEKNSIPLPDRIFDCVNYDECDTDEFLSDNNNIIFKIDDKYIGMSKYFLPIQDEFIVFDCNNKNFTELLKDYYDGDLQKLVNCEKLGIFIPNDEDMGVLVDYHQFLTSVSSSNVVEIYTDEDLKLINQITSKSYLLDPITHGAVSAAHCQQTYCGSIFKIRSLSGYIIHLEDGSAINISDSDFDRCNRFEKCETEDDYILLIDTLYWSKIPDKDSISFLINNVDRLNYLGFKNLYDLPTEYYNIYEEEKTFREYNGYDNLLQLDQNINVENIVGNIQPSNAHVNLDDIYKTISFYDQSCPEYLDIRRYILENGPLNMQFGAFILQYSSWPSNLSQNLYYGQLVNSPPVNPMLSPLGNVDSPPSPQMSPMQPVNLFASPSPAIQSPPMSPMQPVNLFASPSSPSSPPQSMSPITEIVNLFDSYQPLHDVNSQQGSPLSIRDLQIPQMQIPQPQMQMPPMPQMQMPQQQMQMPQPVNLFESPRSSFHENSSWNEELSVRDLQMSPIAQLPPVTLDRSKTLFINMKSKISNIGSLDFNERFNRMINDAKFVQHLSPLSENVVIAGGYALSYYYKKYMDVDVKYSDIDLFLYDCYNNYKEVCQNIVNKLLEIADVYNIYENENCIIFDLRTATCYRKVQIIKRIYKSPSHVIHGFDVDCCCILIRLDDQSIYVTKRCFYSLKHSTNVYNFDRLSSSYNYRLIKYYNRNFSIYIPYIKILLNNASINVNNKDNTVGDLFFRILLKSLNRITITNKSDYNATMHDLKEINSLDEIDYRFNYINPNEQANNSINRIVLENNLKWYPESKPLFVLPILNDEIKLFRREEFTENVFECSNLFNLYKYWSNELPNPNVFIDLLKKYDGKLIAAGNLAFATLKQKIVSTNRLYFIVTNSENINMMSLPFDILKYLWDNYYTVYIKQSYRHKELSFNEYVSNFKIKIETTFDSNYQHISVDFDSLTENFILPEIHIYEVYSGEPDLKVLNQDVYPLLLFQDGTFMCTNRTYFELQNNVFSYKFDNSVDVNIHDSVTRSRLSAIINRESVINEIVQKFGIKTD